MRRIYQVGALVSLVFSMWVIYEALQYDYYTSLGPGPAFFPVWLGLFMALLSIIWLGQVSFQSVGPVPAGYIPDRSGLFRMVSIVLAVGAFGLLVNQVGWALMMFFFLLFLLIALGRQNLLMTLAISLIGSFGIYYIFKVYLDVQLPGSVLPFLNQLGF